MGAGPAPLLLCNLVKVPGQRRPLMAHELANGVLEVYASDAGTNCEKGADLLDRGGRSPFETFQVARNGSGLVRCEICVPSAGGHSFEKRRPQGRGCLPVKTCSIEPRSR